jgi:predicted TPR repeat methyltransferase
MTLASPLTLARQKAVAGDLDGAWADLAAALKADPVNPQILDDCGVILQKRGDFAQAAAYHAQAAESALAASAPSLSAIMLNLAVCLTHLGQASTAQKLYRDILTIDPRHTRAMVNCGVLLTEKDAAQAEELFMRAHETGDKSFELYMGLANLLRQEARIAESQAWYERAAAMQPQNKQVQFMLALTRGENPPAPPPEHVAGLFDSYADTFEKSLIVDLKYRVPELLMLALEDPLNALKEEYSDLTAIDLGAGTGLMGALLRPHATRSIGVDLSDKMLQKAQQQNIYDDAICGDIVQALHDGKNKFHLATAADTFVYMGDLAPIFEAAAKSLRPGGILAFSAENMDESESGEFMLRATGRYAHDESYLRRLISRNNFSVLSFEKTWLRYNKGVPLDGFIVVLKKS